MILFAELISLFVCRESNSPNYDLILPPIISPFLIYILQPFLFVTNGTADSVLNSRKLGGYQKY